MRHLMTALIIAASMGAVPGADHQARGAAQTGACALLPQAEVKKIARPDDVVFDHLAPKEERLGDGGSTCRYSGVTVQLDPFPPAELEELRKTIGKDWTSVPDTGDAAYFRDNRGAHAEVYVRAGQHVVTVQLSVPRGSSAESVRAAAVALARALTAKLQ